MKHFTADGQLAGLITDIQKYSIHDGPGIRTEVFFKGCPLHCPWCSNPETIDPEPQIGVRPKNCMGSAKCGLCLDACPLGNDSPLAFDENDGLLPLSMVEECRDCQKCVAACPGAALFAWGKLYTVDELVSIIEADREFYDKSGGGVTVSGGDVTMQWEFATELLTSCQDRQIGTCVETEAFCPQEHLDALLDHADIVIFDIKHMDPQVHMDLTGVSNEQILANIEHAAKRGMKIIVRTPVVIGYTDSDENILATARFVRDHVGDSLVVYQLLPYRKLGTEKHDSLGQPYPMEDYSVPPLDVWQPNLNRLRDLVASEVGIPVTAGYEDKLDI